MFNKDVVLATEAVIQYMGTVMYAACKKAEFRQQPKDMLIDYVENLKEKHGLVIINPTSTDLYVNRQFITRIDQTITESKDNFAVHDHFGNEIYNGTAFECIHYVDEFLMVE